MIRDSIQTLTQLSIRSCEEATYEEVLALEKIIRELHLPISDDEARVLVAALPEDVCDGLTLTIIGIIETAPGWPLMDTLTDTEDYWINYMLKRISN